MRTDTKKNKKLVSMANHTAKDMTVIKDTDLNTLLEERFLTGNKKKNTITY